MEIEGFIPPPFQGVFSPKSASHKALKSIARDKLNFDERVVSHRVVARRLRKSSPADDTSGRGLHSEALDNSEFPAEVGGGGGGYHPGGRLGSIASPDGDGEIGVWGRAVRALCPSALIGYRTESGVLMPTAKPTIGHGAPRLFFFAGALRPIVGNTAGIIKPFSIHFPLNLQLYHRRVLEFIFGVLYCTVGVLFSMQDCSTPEPQRVCAVPLPLLSSSMRSGS